MKTRWKQPFYDLSKQFRLIHYAYPNYGGDSESAVFLLPREKNDKYKLWLTYTQYPNRRFKIEIEAHEKKVNISKGFMPVEERID